MIKINVDDTVENADWPKRTNDLINSPGYQPEEAATKSKKKVRSMSPAVAAALTKSTEQ